jgi:hypothetical protein
MSSSMNTALIAGSVSVVIALITYLTTRWKTRQDLEGAFASRLQELRITHYPQAFEITERLSKRGELDIVDASKLWLNLITDLRHWKSGVPSLIMSRDAIEAYYKVNEALKTTFAKGDHFGQQQVDKIANYRDKFREVLRRDIGI